MISKAKELFAAFRGEAELRSVAEKYGQDGKSDSRTAEERGGAKRDMR